MKFLSPEVDLYLYKSTVQPCIKYCWHVWAGFHRCYLELAPSLGGSLELLAHGGNLASVSLLYRYYFGKCSSELA